MKQDEIKRMQDEYCPGTRVYLHYTDDKFYRKMNGMYGTVISIDDMGHVHCMMDNSFSATLVKGEDVFEFLDPQVYQAPYKALSENGKVLKGSLVYMAPHSAPLIILKGTSITTDIFTSDRAYAVKENTVSKFSGRLDKCKNAIYENDMLCLTLEDNEEPGGVHTSVVTVKCIKGKWLIENVNGLYDDLDEFICERCEYIGSKIQNM